MTNLPRRIDKHAAVQLVHAAIVLVVVLSYLSYVFQVSHHTFRSYGLGDWGDPYFINFLLEHWHHSVWTFKDPSSPPMYFPVRGALGYSHGLILYAPFYLAVRPFLAPFLSHSATLFLVLAAGSLCLYLVLRRSLGLGFIESLLLSAFFFSSRNVINGRTHFPRRSLFRISIGVLVGFLLVTDWNREVFGFERPPNAQFPGMHVGVGQSLFTAARSGD